MLSSSLALPTQYTRVDGRNTKQISCHVADMLFGSMTVVTSAEVQVSVLLKCLQFPPLHLPRVWVLDEVSGDIIQPFGVTPPFSGKLSADTLCGFKGWIVVELKTPGGMVLDPSVSIGCFGTVLYASRARSEPVFVSLGESRQYNEDDLMNVSTPPSPRSI